MTRPVRLLPLLLLALALSACNMAASPTLPSQKTQAAKLIERQNAAILATPMQIDAESADASRAAPLVQASATLGPTPQPTFDIAPLLAENERIKQQLQQMADSQISDQKEIASKYATAAADNKQAARYNLAQADKALEVAVENSYQRELENEKIEKLRQLAEAEALRMDAVRGQIGILCVLVLTVCATILMLRAMRAPFVIRTTPKRETGERAAPIAVSKATDDYDTTPPGDLAQFAALLDHGVRGGAFGNGSVMDSQIYRAKDYAPVRVWLDRKEARRTEGNEPSLFKPGPNNSRILSVAGIVWAQSWLDWYNAQPPALDAQTAENTTETGNGHVENGRFDGKNTAGEYHDPHGILPKVLPKDGDE